MCKQPPRLRPADQVAAPAAAAGLVRDHTCARRRFELEFCQEPGPAQLRRLAKHASKQGSLSSGERRRFSLALSNLTYSGGRSFLGGGISAL